MTGIIDGRKWLEERMATLRAALEGETDEEKRAAIETEIAMIEPELNARRHRGWMQRLFGGRLPQ